MACSFIFTASLARGTSTERFLSYIFILINKYAANWSKPHWLPFKWIKCAAGWVLTIVFAKI